MRAAAHCLWPFQDGGWGVGVADWKSRSGLRMSVVLFCRAATEVFLLLLTFEDGRMLSDLLVPLRD